MYVDVEVEFSQFLLFRLRFTRSCFLYGRAQVRMPHCEKTDDATNLPHRKEGVWNEHRSARTATSPQCKSYYDHVPTKILNQISNFKYDNFALSWPKNIFVCWCIRKRELRWLEHHGLSVQPRRQRQSRGRVGRPHKQGRFLTESDTFILNYSYSVYVNLY